MRLYRISWLVRYNVFRLLARKPFRLGLLGKPLFVTGVKRIFLGNRVRIFPMWRIEVGSAGKVVVESNVSIGHGLHLTVFASNLSIGKNTVVSSNVLITDNDHTFDDLNVPIMDQPLKVSQTIIGNDCFIGAGAKILAGSVLGDHCIVGANSVVRGEFPGFCIIAGSPAKIIKVYDHTLKLWSSYDPK